MFKTWFYTNQLLRKDFYHLSTLLMINTMKMEAFNSHLINLMNLNVKDLVPIKKKWILIPIMMPLTTLINCQLEKETQEGSIQEVRNKLVIFFHWNLQVS